MKLGKLLLVVGIVLFSACKKNHTGTPVFESCDECLNLSELETRTEYDSTFNLFDDIYQSALISARLNGEEISTTPYISFEDEGYYELSFTHKGESDIEITNYQFVILNNVRGETEWGLKKWIPPIPDFNLTGSENIEAIYPKQSVVGNTTPVVLKVKEGASLAETKYGECQAGEKAFLIKRGVGSVQLALNNSETQTITVGGNSIKVSTSLISENLFFPADTIAANISLQSNTTYHVENDIFISSGVVLSIPEGVTLLFDEGVNLYNKGTIQITGSLNNPVHLTSYDPDTYWGGFISEGQSAEIKASHAFFCRSGFHHAGKYAYGHANRQALFRIDNSLLELDNCYMLDHIGQVFYPTYSTLQVTNCVVMRAKTGGELSHSEVAMEEVYFSDFPDDSQNFRDEDNDALYLSNSNAVIDNCTFMYAKDDGLDTGSDEGGVITITDSHFEACFHEGLAMSCYQGSYKRHTVTNSTFTRCGQGAELGFSSTNHAVVLDNCLATENLIGIRYGDNYNWSVIKGSMTVRNSKAVNNIDKDIWNMVRSDWAPKLNNMKFESTLISIPTNQYPDLEIIQE